MSELYCKRKFVFLFFTIFACIFMAHPSKVSALTTEEYPITGPEGKFVVQDDGSVMVKSPANFFCTTDDIDLTFARTVNVRINNACTPNHGTLHTDIYLVPEAGSAGDENSWIDLKAYAVEQAGGNWTTGGNYNITYDVSELSGLWHLYVRVPYTNGSNRIHPMKVVFDDKNRTHIVVKKDMEVGTQKATSGVNGSHGSAVIPSDWSKYTYDITRVGQISFDATFTGNRGSMGAGVNIYDADSNNKLASLLCEGYQPAPSNSKIMVSGVTYTYTLDIESLAESVDLSNVYFKGSVSAFGANDGGSVTMAISPIRLKLTAPQITVKLPAVTKYNSGSEVKFAVTTTNTEQGTWYFCNPADNGDEWQQIRYLSTALTHELEVEHEEGSPVYSLNLGKVPYDLDGYKIKFVASREGKTAETETTLSAVKTTFLPALNLSLTGLTVIVLIRTIMSNIQKISEVPASSRGKKTDTSYWGLIRFKMAY